mmetsp:Transcript_1352/g.3635  ORF Transcript_1352/g.3635 Transcript_1352/m.3635 type:complete len:98 (-) Transcript_1352:36-329(-)
MISLIELDNVGMVQQPMNMSLCLDGLYMPRVLVGNLLDCHGFASARFDGLSDSAEAAPAEIWSTCGGPIAIAKRLPSQPQNELATRVYHTWLIPPCH